MFKFKVISKFPFSPWIVGQIVEVNDPQSVLMSGSSGYINLFNYPNIFQQI